MLTTVFVGIISGVIAAIIYGLLMAQREEQIRNWLKHKTHGWIRKRYVYALVGAVRGRAGSADSALIGYLILAVIGAFGILTQFSIMQIERSHARNVDSIARIENKLHNKNQGSNKQQITSDFEEVKKKVEEVTLAIQPLIITATILYIFYYVLVLAGIFFWIPFITIRKRFSTEIERFTLRIQGLANKQELAELALAESRVRNEETLKHFIKIAKSIATQHNVPQLVDAFDLWTDD